MSVVEFQTYIEQGTIKLPKEFQDRVKGHARIIILTEDHRNTEDMVDFLLDNPYQVESFKPLTRNEIYY